ncbi:MAG: hypothetical protein A4E66_02377 [Syntrophus sp. PtaB.Bin001]|nr:MAG: hypothetical protein A4E66_02377 [Syntrophus sp. PtaB.Bin001]
MQRIHQGIPLRQRPGKPDIAVTQLGNHPGKLHEKSHACIKRFSAEPRHRLQRGNIRFFGKSIFPGLRPEQFIIDRLVIKEELSGNYVTHMPAADDYRGRYVPHVVFALVEFISSSRHAGGQLDIAFDAVPAGLGVGSMEFFADFPPSRSRQHLAVQIDNSHGDVEKLMKTVHERLNRRNIENVGKLEIYR